jgi:hypothetical protein
VVESPSLMPKNNTFSMVQLSVTSCQPDPEFISNGNILLSPHETIICQDASHTSCDKLPRDLVIPPVLVDLVATLNISCVIGQRCLIFR